MNFYILSKYLVLIAALVGHKSTETSGIMLTCGSNLELYNLAKQFCDDGQVFNRTATPSSSTTTATHVSIVASDSKPIVKRRTCRSFADLLNCNGNLQCGRSQGYKCCGFAIYQPGNQTCCQQSSSQYRIHNGKPEKTHICCRLEVYGRCSSDTKCLHPACNDKFFQNPTTLPTKIVNNQTICPHTKYVFRIDILQQVNGQYLSARVGAWAWPRPDKNGKVRMRKSPRRQEVMKIKLDRYSPMRKNLTRKSFVIFSRHQHLKDAVLLLRKNDFVYRSPVSQKKMIRRVRKMYKKCKH